MLRAKLFTLHQLNRASSWNQTIAASSGWKTKVL